MDKDECLPLAGEPVRSSKKEREVFTQTNQSRMILFSHMEKK